MDIIFSIHVDDWEWSRGATREEQEKIRRWRETARRLAVAVRLLMEILLEEALAVMEEDVERRRGTLKRETGAAVEDVLRQLEGHRDRDVVEDILEMLGAEENGESSEEEQGEEE